MTMRKLSKNLLIGMLLTLGVGYSFPTDNWSLPTDPNSNIRMCDFSSSLSLEKEETISSSSREFESLQLALARICVSESGFQIRTLDCRLIYEVLRNRSRTGELTLGIMRSYSTATFNRHRTDSRRWIPFLDPRGAMPRHWSESTHLSWSAYRSNFLDVYRYAGYLIRHNPTYPCTLPVHHWGARNFRVQRLLRSGWIRVECEINGRPTLNQFWLVPSSLRAGERVCNGAERACIRQPSEI